MRYMNSSRALALLSAVVLAFQAWCVMAASTTLRVSEPGSQHTEAAPTLSLNAIQPSMMSKYTCGDTVSFYVAAKPNKQTGDFVVELDMDAYSSKVLGVGFTNCLQAVPMESSTKIQDMEEHQLGKAFERDSITRCRVFGNAEVASDHAVETLLRIDARLGCKVGTKAQGDLFVRYGKEALHFQGVENIQGAQAPFLVFEKTVTTGDGLCGIHDAKELRDSYVQNDQREIKFCYKVMNRGTQTACNVALSQKDGLEDGVDLPVSVNSLGDSCVAGSFDSLPGSTTHGSGNFGWSVAYTEKLIRYPCGVTHIEPVASLRYNAALETRNNIDSAADASDLFTSSEHEAIQFSEFKMTTSSVKIQVPNECDGGGLGSKSAMADANRQIVQQCSCISRNSDFYVLEKTSVDPQHTEFDLCLVKAATGGWFCIEDGAGGGDEQICDILIRERHVPIRPMFDDNLLGMTVACVTRDVQIVTPTATGRFLRQ